MLSGLRTYRAGVIKAATLNRPGMMYGSRAMMNGIRFNSSNAKQEGSQQEGEDGKQETSEQNPQETSPEAQLVNE